MNEKNEKLPIYLAVGADGKETTFGNCDCDFEYA